MIKRIAAILALTAVTAGAWTFGSGHQGAAQGVLNGFANTYPPLSDAERQAEVKALSIPGAIYPGSVANLGAWYTASPRWLRTKEGKSGWSASNLLRATANTNFQPGTGDFTFAGWVNMTTINSADGTLASVYIATGEQRGWSVRYNSSTNRFQILASPDGTATLYGAQNTTVVATSTWYYVIGWKSGTSLFVQVNNSIPDAGTFVGSAVFSSSAQFQLGSGGNGWILGSMDQAQYWSRVLTSNERTWLYNSGAGRNYRETGNTITVNDGSNLRTNLVAWWEMNGTNAGVDQTGNNSLTTIGTLTSVDGVVEEWPSNGAKIYRAIDRRSSGGTDALQATFATRPVYNASGYLDINHTYLGAASALLYAKSSAWLAFAGAITGTDNYNAFFQVGNGLFAPRISIAAIYVWSGTVYTNVRRVDGDSYSNVYASGTTGANTVWDATADFTAGITSLNANGVSYPTTTVTTGVTSSTSGNVLIGSDNIYGRFFGGLVYESLPDAATRAGVRKYLGSSLQLTVYDSDAAAFILTAGITNAAQQFAINYLVSDLKRYGLWNGLIALYPFVGGTSSTHSYNLKNPSQYQITWGGTTPPTHSANGVTGTGAGFGNTGIVPSVVGFSANSLHFGAYTSSTTTLSTGVDAGTGPIGLWGIVDVGTSFGWSSASLPAAVIGSNTLAGWRLGSALNGNLVGYFNSTIIGSLAGVNSVSSSGTTNPFYLCARYRPSAGGAALYDSANYRLLSIGSGLTTSQSATYYRIVQNFETILSRQVP